MVKSHGRRTGIFLLIWIRRSPTVANGISSVSASSRFTRLFTHIDLHIVFKPTPGISGVR